jgi:hypothetical protein
MTVIPTEDDGRSIAASAAPESSSPINFADQ